MTAISRRPSDWDLDLKANGVSRWRGRYVLTLPELYFLRLLRRAEARLRNVRGSVSVSRFRYLWARWRLEQVSVRLGFVIPLNVFGGGLSIAHRGPIVVNRGAIVGQRCRIHPGVTIGAANGASPIIGDDVFLGPNVVVVGGISIGNGVRIAANSFISVDLADDVRVRPAPFISKSGKE